MDTFTPSPKSFSRRHPRLKACFTFLLPHGAALVYVGYVGYVQISKRSDLPAIGCPGSVLEHIYEQDVLTVLLAAVVLILIGILAFSRSHRHERARFIAGVYCGLGLASGYGFDPIVGLIFMKTSFWLYRLGLPAARGYDRESNASSQAE